MNDTFENIKRIVDRVLGDPKRDYAGAGDWYEYNCPNCAEENGDTPDGKYNLAVQISEEGLWAHCWKCGRKWKLYKLIKMYGSQADVDDYKEEIAVLRESRLFNLSNGVLDDLDDFLKDDELFLPDGYSMFNKDSWDCKTAKQYLEGRGVDDKVIEKYHLGFVGFEKGNRFSKRIVIPSYDVYGDLNYWVARDYSDKAYRKILNPDVDKKKIVFNEKYINWYEPVTIVEGPFDHIVVPNSIPLLGKSLDESCAVYKAIIEKSHSTINILLDDDAITDAKKMYKFLNAALPNRIRLIECPDGYDASDYYRDYGYKGILKLMHTARKMTDFELAML